MSEYVEVTVCQGKLRGIKEYRIGLGTIIAFRGIPYAKPPVGELRFKDPEPAEPWDGVRDASKFGNVAPQIHLLTRKPIGNDDCLYLNVYTMDIHMQPKCPVMVWIHGGSFVNGSGSYTSYGPDYIVTKQVVLVTINYRLGALGFLKLDDEMAPGNQGLKDALMALRWVHCNISNFGGDPENVTIFGQGIGGAIVHYLAVCPQADGLFHKAISQSGTAAIAKVFSEKDAQKARSFLLVKELGKRTKDPKEAVRFLRSIDAKDIVIATSAILTNNDRLQFNYPFVPTVDCDSPNPFFAEHPAIMLCRGVKVPYIIGFNSCEGSLIGQIFNDQILEHMNSDFASIIPPNILSMLKRKSLTAEDVRCRYFGNEPVSMKTIANVISLLGDMHFHFGIFETIHIQALLGHRSTYLYKFSYESKCSHLKKLLGITFPGAVHGEELLYLFCPRCECQRCKMGLNIKNKSEDWTLTDRVTQMWTDFAKTGNPTPTITSLIPIKWGPQEKEDEFQFLFIDNDLRLETMRKEQLRFFEAM